METLEITTLSSKGQIVIPGSIRKELNVHEGSKFAVITDGDNILLKKIDKPNIKEFAQLIKESRKIGRQKNINRKDLDKVIKNVRKKKSRN